METNYLYLFVIDFMKGVDITLRRIRCSDHHEDRDDVSLTLLKGTFGTIT